MQGPEERQRGFLPHGADAPREDVPGTDPALHADGLPVARFTLDPDGRVRTWDRASQRVFGWSAEEVVGRHPWMLLAHEGERLRLAGLIERALESNAPLHASGESRTKSGARIRCEWILAPERDERGTFTGITAVVQDVSARLRAVDAMRASRRRLLASKLLGDTLNDVALLLEACMDTDAAMRRTLPFIAEALQAPTALVSSLDEGTWTVQYAHGVSARAEGVHYPYDPEGMAERALSTMRPEVSPAPPEGLACGGALPVPGARAVLHVPLAVGCKGCGVMSLFRVGRAGAFTEAETDFARKLSHALSLKLENLRLQSERERAFELGEGLASVISAVNASLEREGILGAAVSRVRGLLGADASCAALFDGDAWTLRLCEGYPEEMEGASFPSDGVPHAALALRSESPVAVSDTTTDDRVGPAALGIECRSLLVVPLTEGDRDIGALCYTFHGRSHHFSDAEMDFARKLSVSLSLALRNARLLEERLRAERLNRALHDVNLRIASTLDPDRIMQEVVSNASSALGCDSAHLSMREDGLWVIRYVHRRSENWVGRRLTDEQATLTAFTAKERRPVIVRDLLVDPLAPGRLDPCRARALLAVPLVVRDEVIGVLDFTHVTPGYFEPSHAEFALNLAASVALALENARLYANEHRIADTLQEALLTMPGKVAGLRFSHVYRSATDSARVGGDFYDVFELDDGRVALLLGDVSGKGLEAAALTSVVKNVVRAHALEESNPARVVAKVNEGLHHDTPSETFVTLFFGILDLADGRLEYCAAGHPPPLLLTQDGQVLSLNPNSPIVGAWEKAPFSCSETKLDPSDVLLLYSDGVTECRRGRELFGEERLRLTVREASGRGPGEVVATVFRSMLHHAGRRLDDDVALLALCLEPEAATPGRAVQGRLEITL